MKAEGTDDIYYSTIPDVKVLHQAGELAAEDVFVTTTGDQITLNGVALDDLGFLHLISDVIPATAIVDFDRGSTMSDLLNINVNKIQLRLLNAGADASAEIYETLVAPAMMN